MTNIYPGHIPLSIASRIMLGIGSAAAAIYDPGRGDMVATMGEVTATQLNLERIRQRMESDIIGSRILNEQPRVTNETVDIKYLRTLPDNTFGKEYSKFLDNLKTSPDARPPVKFVQSKELTYIMQRYRETHDFNHVLLQMPTHMLGEVTVKYFEAIQFGLPMCITAGLFGAIRLQKNHRKRFLTHNLPWIVEQAQHSRFFLAVDWENQWEEPVSSLQEKLGVVPIEKYTP
ncbi:coenzyme Q biosynthesis protein Coq4 [Dictyocaulus viviparus]|uniref:Ubiquinone biosynthesis protein COQ4 homolog, mitochondrial n=1 Tax=Dictyocaulus viviparus TaxID=29172 RepID=A0A0D8Y862_DICVI|nr:coenzyme Q biosynthesis protein Coq4 [Dictyocaulus viviparus]